MIARVLLVATLALSSLTAAGSAAPPGPADAERLPAPIREALRAHDVPPEAVSILIQPRDGSAPLLRFNASEPRNPASVMKLFTTFAVLEELGPAYTWETRIHADGPIDNGVLTGNLWIEGSGDPFFMATDFWQLLGSIRRRGIERITGDLILASSRFAPVTRDPGAFDGEPFRAYNQPPHPLLVNLNAIEFELESVADEHAVRVSMYPPIGNLPVQNRLQLESGIWCSGYRWHVDYAVDHAMDTAAAIFEGKYGKGCGVGRLRRTGLPVEEYVHGLFTALWRHWGGHFDGGWRIDHGPERSNDPLARHTSRPLAEVVRLTNKYSNNVMARQLALSLAAADSVRPVSETDARIALRTALGELGVATDGMVLDEVAGLSRTNRITVDHVTSLLEAAADSLIMPEFVTSLPIAGVDGTLRNRLDDGPEAGRLRMKTGMIDHVSAIAGYIRDAADRELTAVILINHNDIHRGRGIAVQDAILRWAFRQGSD